MYSFSNFESVGCSMSASNCCFLACMQVSQEAYKMVWYSHLFKNFPQFVMTHRVKGIVNEADRWFYRTLSLFYDPMDVGNLISGSSAFSKSSLNIWKFTVSYCWSLAWRILNSTFASMWNECNCVVVWTVLDTAFLWDWNESWPSPVLWPLLSFPDMLPYWVQHFDNIIF